MLFPLDAVERTAYLDELIYRTTPSFDFFLFSLLCGAVLGIAILINSPTILLLAALAAPFLGPIIGLSLATILGSGKYFFRSLLGAAVGGGLVFGMGALSGVASQRWPNLVLDQSLLRVQLSWVDFFALSLAVILITISMRRSTSQPLLPNVILAYELYLPLGIAGFGLTGRIPDLWPDGLVIFAIYLTWTILLATITLAVLGFRPLNFFGYTLGTTFAILLAVALIGMGGFGTKMGVQVAVALPTPLPTLTVTETLVTPTITETPTITITTAAPSRTPTRTLVPTETPTMTLTPIPTPVWAIVTSETGAWIREQPLNTSKIVGSLLKGSLVEVLPEVEKQGNITWVHVRTSKDVEGWIVQSLLATATPAPGW